MGKIRSLKWRFVKLCMPWGIGTDFTAHRCQASLILSLLDAGRLSLSMAVSGICTSANMVALPQRQTPLSGSRSVPQQFCVMPKRLPVLKSQDGRYLLYGSAKFAHLKNWPKRWLPFLGQGDRNNLIFWLNGNCYIIPRITGISCSASSIPGSERVKKCCIR